MNFVAVFCDTFLETLTAVCGWAPSVLKSLCAVLFTPNTMIYLAVVMLYMFCSAAGMCWDEKMYRQFYTAKRSCWQFRLACIMRLFVLVITTYIGTIAVVAVFRIIDRNDYGVYGVILVGVMSSVWILVVARIFICYVECRKQLRRKWSL